MQCALDYPISPFDILFSLKLRALTNWMVITMKTKSYPQGGDNYLLVGQ